MSECGESFMGRGFDTIRIFYPRFMTSSNSSQISVSASGVDFASSMQIQATVPLEALEPSYLSSYVDMRLDIKGQVSQDERLLTPASLEISALGIREVRQANNTVPEQAMPLVQKFFRT